MTIARLLTAAEAGDLDLVKELVRSGTDVNVTDRNGETALMEAAFRGHIQVIRFLVEEGADVNATNNYSETALMMATCREHIEVVRYLAEERGADVNTSKRNGETSLMIAAFNGHIEMVRYLAGESGADINATNNIGDTALLIATSREHIKVIRHLAGEYGADVNVTNSNGETALMVAAFRGYIEVVRYLVEEGGADVNATNNIGGTALMGATYNGHVEVVRYLAGECGADVNGSKRNGETALMLAAYSGHIELVRYLAGECGANLNVMDSNGFTAVTLAASRDNIEVILYLARECGADVNTTTNDGYTALTNAAYFGRLEVVRLLVEECGVNVDSTDSSGETALIKAASRGHIDVVRYLAGECGADVNCTDQDGNSSIRLASNRGHQDVVRFLKTFLMRPQSTISEACSSDSMLSNSTSSWIIPPSEIELIHFDTTGSIGGEFIAKWLDADVIVKLFIPDAAQTPFKKELELWQQLRHPNVIKMYGACEVGPDLQFFVCEYAGNGPLNELVNTEKQATWKYLYEAALGLEYLHERGIVHGDLRCSNILIGNDGLAKLSNFGLSGAMTRGSIGIGSMRWQAPEVLRGEDSSPFVSDVYSLGMCILEAATGDKPWASGNSKYNDDAVIWIKRDWAPETNQYDLFSPYCPDNDAYELVRRLCCQDPAKRMKLRSVVYELERLDIKQRLSCIKPEHEPLYTLDDYNYGETNQLWSKVQTRMAESDNAKYRRLFDELKALYERLRGRTHHGQLLNEFNTLLTKFLDAVKMTPEQALAIRLSSTRAFTENINSLHSRIGSLWESLEQSVGESTEKVARWEKQRRELFLSEVSVVCPLLKEVESDYEKVAFLKTLKREMTNQYEDAQLKALEKAFEDIESNMEKNTSKLIPEWFIPWYELNVDKGNNVGIGGFGSVFRAKWLDSEVVVKQVNLDGSNERYGTSSWSKATTAYSSIDSQVDDPGNLERVSKNQSDVLPQFRREVDIWFGFSHPHVIQLFGACHVGRPFFVCEYATNGTLVEYLLKHPGTLWEKLHEAALGVQYLHARGVVHGDLKGNNIVVGSDTKAKVTDFGLSSIVNNSEESQITAASHWVAPECFFAKPQLTFESDVYSLGMCIVEAMRVVGGEEHSLPWLTVENVVVRVMAKRGKLPPRPTRCTDAQWELVERMCTFQPEKRIKISTVVAELARLSREKCDVTPESSSLKLVRDSASAMKTLLLQLHDSVSEVSRYIDLWDEIEKVCDKNIVGVKSSVCTSEVFYCLVKDAEIATLKLQEKKTDLISSVEKTMAVFALHRRLVKFKEAYFIQ